MKKVWVIVILLAIWQLTCTFFSDGNGLIPSPFEIGRAFIEVLASGEIIIHVLSSLKRVLIGFGIASFLGVTLALILGYYKNLGKVFEPIIELLRPIPPIAWIPIAIILFGLGDVSSYFIVFLGAFFPIFTNAYFGVISLPKIYENTALSFELSRIEFIKKILFYYSLPYIFTGLKIGIGMAWMSVIAAELIGAQDGLGYFIQFNRLLLRTDNVLVGMVLIGIIGLILNFVLDASKKILVPWSKE